MKSYYPEDYLKKQIANLCNRPSHGDAFHNLIEAEHSAIPLLMEAFQTETRPRARAILVRVIWEYRLPESLDFLLEAMTDQSDRVWKSALDGIVAIGGTEGLRILEKLKTTAHLRNKHSQEFLDWINEAIDQVREKLVAGKQTKGETK